MPHLNQLYPNYLVKISSVDEERVYNHTYAVLETSPERAELHTLSKHRDLFKDDLMQSYTVTDVKTLD